MNNFKGILLMLIAMAGFTMEDLFMKKLSVNLSTGQILITLGFGSSLVFALMAKSKGYKLTAKIFWSKGMLIRTICRRNSSHSIHYVFDTYSNFQLLLLFFKQLH